MLWCLAPYSLNGCKHDTSGIMSSLLTAWQTFAHRHTDTRTHTGLLCYCVTFMARFLHLSANLGSHHVNNNGSRRCAGGWMVKTNQWCRERKKNMWGMFLLKRPQRLLILSGVWVFECVVCLWAWNAVSVCRQVCVCLCQRVSSLNVISGEAPPSVRACLSVRVCVFWGL